MLDICSYCAPSRVLPRSIFCGTSLFDESGRVRLRPVFVGYGTALTILRAPSLCEPKKRTLASTLR